MKSHSISVLIVVVAFSIVSVQFALAQNNDESPKMQMSKGILAEDVTCEDGLVLAIKASSGTAVCVNQDSAEKLLGRGWTTPVDDFVRQMDDLFEQRSITAEQLKNQLQSNELVFVIDIRDEERFKEGHIEGSANGKCDDQSKTHILPKMPKNVKTILVDDDDSKVKGLIRVMYKMGFDVYHLDGGIKSWPDELVADSTDIRISAEELYNRIQNGEDMFLLDVREPEEFSEGEIPNVVNMPLGNLFEPDGISNIPKDKEIIIICRSGNRAMIASFALANEGYDFKILDGGMKAWLKFLDESQIEHKNGIPVQNLP